MIKVLIADDEHALANFLQRGLRAENYDAQTVHQLHEIVPLVRQQSPDILILDRMFADEDSLSLVDSIKQLPDPPMILMLTALDEVAERVKGLTHGADEYLCKPFDFEELLARISVLLRLRSRMQDKRANDDSIELSQLKIDSEQRIATIANDELKLSKIEFSLLKYFADNIDKVISRERILAKVWETHTDPHTNVVDVYVSHLRKKIAGDKNLRIETVRGNGYRFGVLSEQETE